MGTKLKLGLTGLGHLGKIHLKCILDCEEIELVGCYDLDKESLHNICTEYNVRAFDSYEDLLQNCEAVDIVTPTVTHFKLASQAIAADKHCFIEKPVTVSLDQALALKELQQKQVNVLNQ